MWFGGNGDVGADDVGDVRSEPGVSWDGDAMGEVGELRFARWDVDAVVSRDCDGDGADQIPEPRLVLRVGREGERDGNVVSCRDVGDGGATGERPLGD